MGQGVKMSAGVQGFGRLNVWYPISNAPFGRDLELAVIDRGETHALVFPCRRILGGWTSAETGERIEVHPTHWREWQAEG